MENRSRLELANDNAASFWLAQASVQGWEHARRPGFTAVRCDRNATDIHRVVITRPYTEPDALHAELFALLQDWGTTHVWVEDPYRRLDLAPYGYEAGLALAVMTREPGLPDVVGGRHQGSASGPSVTGASGEGLVVEEAVDADALAEVERTVVDGFPIPAWLPWQPAHQGRLLHAGLLAVPGYRAWLARIDGRPAGACMTYDNGETLGVYWVATMPDYRAKGVGRAVLTAALAAGAGGRVTTLVATLLGEPLYRRLGFVEQGTTRWWRRSGAVGGAPDAGSAAGRAVAPDAAATRSAR